MNSGTKVVLVAVAAGVLGIAASLMTSGPGPWWRTEPVVHQALADYVLLQADVTANDAQDQALMQRFGIIGPPMSLFFVDGAERRELRLTGFEKAGAFVERARRGSAR